MRAYIAYRIHYYNIFLTIQIFDESEKNLKYLLTITIRRAIINLYSYRCITKDYKLKYV